MNFEKPRNEIIKTPEFKIKEGVDFVFEQNPELVNTVYEALGFNNKLLSKVQLVHKFAHRYDIVYDGKRIGNFELPLDLDGTSVLIGDVEIDAEYRGKGFGVEAYKAAIDLSPKPIESLLASPEANRVWESLVKQKLAVKNEDGYKTIKPSITPQQEQQVKEIYSKYLDTIFPDSKFKDILYHGSPNINIEKFLSPQDELYVKHENTTTGSTGVYFADSLDEAKRYTSWNEGENGKVYPVVLDIQKFFTVADKILDGINGGFSKSILWNIQKGMLDTLKSNDIDAFVAGEHMIKTEGFKEVVILNTNKIHILGSKQDIEKFKEFVSKSRQEQVVV